MNKAKLPTHFRLSPLALALASIGMGHTVVAQDELAPLDKYSDTEIIEIIGKKTEADPSSVKFARPLLDTAQTINIVPSRLIEERGATTLRDVLRNVSGISMQAGEGGTPAGDQLSIRGYSARTDIFVDNVRDFGGYTRDPFNLEQVEVVKGPSSDYSGRGSTGGSINLVSKAPRLSDHTNSSIAFGTENFNRLTLDSNHALENTDNAAVRLNLMVHDQDVAGRDQVSNQRWAIAPSIGFGLETDTEVTLSLFHMQQDNVPDYGIPWVPTANQPLAAFADGAPPVDFNNWYGLNSRDFEEISTSMITAQVNQRLSNSLSLNNITRWGLTDRDSMITAPRFISNDSTDIRRSDEKYRDQQDDIINNSTNLRWDIDSGSNLEHRVLFGVEVSLEGEKRYTQALTGTDSPATDLFNPTPNDPYLENYQRTGTAATSDSTTLAAYITDSMQVGEHWQINGGLRWDRFEMEYTPDGGTLEERTDTVTSYRAGVVYKPVETGSIYFGYGTSFNPSTETLSFSNRDLGRGIAELDPEENRSFELGTKWEIFDRKLFVSAAIFHTDKTNARVLDSTGTSYRLEGEQSVQGFEFGLAGSITDTIAVSAGYTHMRTEVESTGNELDNSPENSLSLWTTYQATETLQIGFGTQYVDDRFNNESNLRTAPDYTLYELSANYTINDKIGLRLNLQNLTDEKYIDFVGGGHFIPGLGRTALLTANFNF